MNSWKEISRASPPDCQSVARMAVSAAVARACAATGDESKSPIVLGPSPPPEEPPAPPPPPDEEADSEDLPAVDSEAAPDLPAEGSGSPGLPGLDGCLGEEPLGWKFSQPLFFGVSAQKPRRSARRSRWTARRSGRAAFATAPAAATAAVPTCRPRVARAATPAAAKEPPGKPARGRSDEGTDPPSAATRRRATETSATRADWSWRARLTPRASARLATVARALMTLGSRRRSAQIRARLKNLLTSALFEGTARLLADFKARLTGRLPRAVAVRGCARERLERRGRTSRQTLASRARGAWWLWSRRRARRTTARRAVEKTRAQSRR